MVFAIFSITEQISFNTLLLNSTLGRRRMNNCRVLTSTLPMLYGDFGAVLTLLKRMIFSFNIVNYLVRSRTSTGHPAIPPTSHPHHNDNFRHRELAPSSLAADSSERIILLKEE